MTPRVLAWIALGGILGSFARFLLSYLWNPDSVGGFPTGTLIINVLGCLAIGMIAPVLAGHFDKVLSLASGFADGGDILTTQDLVMIGLSARTDHTGAEALQSALAELGRKSEIVTTPPGVLHFKTDCSLLDEERILSTRRLAASGVFSNFRIITVPEGEEAAANALRINDVVLVGADYPRTIEMLQKEGFSVAALKTTEIGKIDAGLSCMSLRWFDASQSQSDPA